MKSTTALNQLCEDFEECGHHFAFLIDVATSGNTLSERAKLGFLEYGMESFKRFAKVEQKLLDYRKSCTPN